MKNHRMKQVNQRHYMKSMGFETRVPEEIFDKTRYLAGPDEKRARLVNQLFEDPDIQAIVCARGGFGSLRMLPLVDFDIISAHPKVFVGFSDITALLAAITRRSGLVTFHGPMVTPLLPGLFFRPDGQPARLLAAIWQPCATCWEHLSKPDLMITFCCLRIAAKRLTALTAFCLK